MTSAYSKSTVKKKKLKFFSLGKAMSQAYKQVKSIISNVDKDLPSRSSIFFLTDNEKNI